MGSRISKPPGLALVTLIAIVAFSASGQTMSDATGRGIRPASGNTGRRIALVIGNKEYERKPLVNPMNDATDMAAALRELGFDVEVVLNTKYRELEPKIHQFTGKLRTGDIGLFYYSGHGIQADGQNWLLPVDFQAGSEDDVKYGAYSANRVRERMRSAGARLSILILDACRDNPYRSWSRSSSGDGLRAMTGAGAFIAFAADEGRTADDRPSARNGLFTGHLLSVLRQPGLGLGSVFDRVRERVYSASNGTQTPFTNSGLIGEFYFREPRAESAVNVEAEYWAECKARGASACRAYLEKFPNGEFAALARNRLAVDPPQPPPEVTPAGRKKVNPADGLTYVWIPPGTFTMGCSPGDNECQGDEKPAHEVTITKGFWMGLTEVTQAAYERVVKTNPSHYKGSDRPVEMVDWHEAHSYCKAIGLRLPTEAEWEYAARAGTKGARYGELREIAWFDEKGTHPVGRKVPNSFGLFDMIGNVREWVSDWYSFSFYDVSQKRDPQGPSTGTDRLTRGGSWRDKETKYPRAAYRYIVAPDADVFTIGFRCAGE